MSSPANNLPDSGANCLGSFLSQACENSTHAGAFTLAGVALGGLLVALLLRSSSSSSSVNSASKASPQPVPGETGRLPCAACGSTACCGNGGTPPAATDAAAAAAAAAAATIAASATSGTPRCPSLLSDCSAGAAPAGRARLARPKRPERKPRSVASPSRPLPARRPLQSITTKMIIMEGFNDGLSSPTDSGGIRAYSESFVTEEPVADTEGSVALSPPPPPPGGPAVESDGYDTDEEDFDTDENYEAESSDSDESDNSDDEENYVPHKMVLVIRMDLGMQKGKIAAQCSHATLSAYSRARDNPAWRPLLRRWMRYSGQAKVTLKGDSEEHLLALRDHARSLDLPTAFIRDAGRTQIAAGSMTVLAIGPAPSSAIDLVTSSLKLY
ncbi:hypothetical protein H696_01420 [Fonticula alba]|uniref:peptidyl-tRNA hydrolase n=1 Tax=Fonticula alba TaxID=691883 RepID=A0A058ZDL3_FONAL|nr:hypothetical protein H696_01420 [Fonticula alba]KCV72013.1 hypothetical protein H696_01420 [Fonticula alba]|eukprot:XP_009493591.1 hypothetical protein H696_01420 [Fonticula alba]